MAIPIITYSCLTSPVLIIDDSYYKNSPIDKPFVYVFNNKFLSVTREDDIPILHGSDKSKIFIYKDSKLSQIWLSKDATVNVEGGAISWINLCDNSRAEINGGIINWLLLSNKANAYLKKVKNLGWIFIREDSKVHIYTNRYSYADGWLSGFWHDGSKFSFRIVFDRNMSNNTLYSNIIIH